MVAVGSPRVRGFPVAGFPGHLTVAGRGGDFGAGVALPGYCGTKMKEG